MKISGYIRTVEGIHISEGTVKNLTKTATKALPDYQNGRIVPVPVIPGSVLRGKFRRAADDIGNEAMKAHGVTIPIEVFNALRHGSTSGRLTNEPVAPSFFDSMRNHPLMGLLGGGPRQGSEGALAIHTMYPYCQETLNLQMVPQLEDIEALPAERLIEEKTTFPRLDITRESDPAFDAVIEDKDAKIDEILTADVQRRVQKASEDGETAQGENEDESTLRASNMVSYQQIIPGVLFYFKASINERAADHVKGFMLVALIRMLQDNRIGGMHRIGLGVDVFDLGSAAANLKLDGQQAFEYDGHEIRPAPGRAAEMVAAYEAWSDGGKAWTREDLWNATGFSGIDLNQAAVKKKKNGGKRK